LVPFQRSANVSNGPSLLGTDPTATQNLFDEHETPLRELYFAPGVRWIDQREPSQRSANAVDAVLVSADPTAAQAVAEAHDTPVRELLTAPRGSGGRRIDQVAPFQRSTIAIRFDSPTAMQNLFDVHDTPLRLLLFAPRGFGVRWIDQVEPFQRSANGAEEPSTAWRPTTMQTLADGHETAVRAPPGTLGVGWIDQPAAGAAPGSHNAIATNATTARAR
jgi:hypothetical protein